MKRHGGLFERIVAFDNLELAYRKAVRGHRYSPSAMRFRHHLEENLITLQNELTWGSYEPRAFRRFTIYEPKERVIYAAAFRDRIVHHAIMNVVEPIWEGLFIDASFACRKGKGTHAGVLHLDRMLQVATSGGRRMHCLKGDISKCFPSINHHVLMGIIQRKIKCQRTLELFQDIIFANGDRYDPSSRDMPIGNLISQWGANLYLNELDQHVKYRLKAHHYMRYMDDWVVLHEDKRQLLAWQRDIEHFLSTKLFLRLNPKTQVFPISRGIDFLGYRTWPRRRLLRKSSARRMTARLRYLRTQYAKGRVSLTYVSASVRSWVSHAVAADSWATRRRVLGSVTLARGEEG